MIEKQQYVYEPIGVIGKVMTYDGRPISDIVQIYESEFILIEINTPEDFFEVGNRVKFNVNFLLGWGGFYPDPQEFSNDKKFVPYQWRNTTHYKYHLGGVYEYKGELYAYTYWT